MLPETKFSLEKYMVGGKGCTPMGAWRSIDLTFVIL